MSKETMLKIYKYGTYFFLGLAVLLTFLGLVEFSLISFFVSVFIHILYNKNYILLKFDELEDKE